MYRLQIGTGRVFLRISAAIRTPSASLRIPAISPRPSALTSSWLTIRSSRAGLACAMSACFAGSAPRRQATLNKQPRNAHINCWPNLSLQSAQIRRSFSSTPPSEIFLLTASFQSEKTCPRFAGNFRTSEHNKGKSMLSEEALFINLHHMFRDFSSRNGQANLLTRDSKNPRSSEPEAATPTAEPL